MPPGGGKGSNGQEEHPAHHGQSANGPATDTFSFRVLDSGLAKAAPAADKLDQKSYRSHRRRLELFQKQCQRRGHNVVVEGAFLCLSLLQDSAWEATEQLNIDEMEAAVNPFQPLFSLLDRLYQYKQDVELPTRCQEFFEKFSR